MKTLTLIILSLMFISCEQQTKNGESLEEKSVDHNVDYSNQEDKIIIELPISDYRSGCDNGMKFKIEVIEERIDINENTFDNLDCTGNVFQDTASFDHEDFYNVADIEELDNGNYMINGLEYVSDL